MRGQRERSGELGCSVGSDAHLAIVGANTWRAVLDHYQRGEPVIARVCAECGKPLPPAKREGRPRAYCNAACVSREHRKRHAQLTQMGS